MRPPTSVVPLLAALVVLAATGAPARADIPLPDTGDEPKRFAEQVEIGPIEPLPPITRQHSEAGAGRLPEGVSVATEVTRLDPVQRETFLVTQTILDPARRLRDVEVHRPEGKGFDVRPISVTRDTVEIDGRLVERRHYRWVVQALRAGEWTLDFHRIDFKVVGSAQSEYAFVPVGRRLEVTPLPAYLPTYLPVTPELTIENVEVDPLIAGEPGDWRFRVRGDGLSAVGLTRLIEAQLVAPPGLRLGAPEVHALPASSEATSPGSSIARVWQVTISLLPSIRGDDHGERRARLPALRLPYIDPRLEPPGDTLDYARLEAREVRWQAEPSARRLASLRAALPWLLAGLVAFAILVPLGRRAWRHGQVRRARRAAQRRLLACEGIVALRRQLLAELQALPQPAWPASRERLARRGAGTVWLAALDRLEAACFARQAPMSPADFAATRGTLARDLPRHWFR